MSFNNIDSTPRKEEWEPKKLAAENPFDLEELSRPKTPPRHKRGEKFLKGPIPLQWLQAAVALRGKALAVGMAVWYRAGVTKRREVKASGALLKEIGIERRSAYRGLSALETAGLISQKKHPGRCPVVTIKEPYKNKDEKEI